MIEVCVGDTHGYSILLVSDFSATFGEGWCSIAFVTNYSRKVFFEDWVDFKGLSVFFASDPRNNEFFIGTDKIHYDKFLSLLRENLNAASGLGDSAPILTPSPKIDLDFCASTILQGLGLNLENSGLKDTPMRMIKMLKELTSGLREEAPKITLFENENNYDQMILERNITVHSLCEHHLLPFTGVAHVSYIPKDKIIGLSKLNRIVEWYSRRPQVQERLTKDIGNYLQEILSTEDVAVVIKAEHLCVKLRGVRDQNSDMVTSFLGGRYRDEAVRMELLSLISL